MFQNGDRAGFIVQPVGRHQEDFRLARGGDHREGFVFGLRQRLLDHDMLAGARRANGEIGMHVVWKRDIHGVDPGARQQRVVAVVADDRFDAIELRKPRRLGSIAGDDRGDARIAGLRHARQERDLRDPSGADDSIVDHRIAPAQGLMITTGSWPFSHKEWGVAAYLSGVVAAVRERCRDLLGDGRGDIAVPGARADRRARRTAPTQSANCRR